MAVSGPGGQAGGQPKARSASAGRRRRCRAAGPGRARADGAAWGRPAREDVQAPPVRWRADRGRRGGRGRSAGVLARRLPGRMTGLTPIAAQGRRAYGWPGAGRRRWLLRRRAPARPLVAGGGRGPVPPQRRRGLSSP